MAVTHRGYVGEGRIWLRCVLAAIVDRDIRGSFTAKTYPTELKNAPYNLRTEDMSGRCNRNIGTFQQRVVGCVTATSDDGKDEKY